MANSDDVQIVLCTAPDMDSARRLASHLVEYRLAACVNLLAGVESVYRWKGAIQHDAETMLVIKARTADYSRVEAAIREKHPYELPEIIAVPLSNGSPEYLDWIRNHNEEK